MVWSSNSNTTAQSQNWHDIQWICFTHNSIQFSQRLHKIAHTFSQLVPFCMQTRRWRRNIRNQTGVVKPSILILVIYQHKQLHMNIINNSDKRKNNYKRATKPTYLSKQECDVPAYLCANTYSVELQSRWMEWANIWMNIFNSLRDHRAISHIQSTLPRILIVQHRQISN